METDKLYKIKNLTFYINLCYNQYEVIYINYNDKDSKKQARKRNTTIGEDGKFVAFTIEDVQEKINLFRNDLIVLDTYIKDTGKSKIRYVKLKFINSDEEVEDMTLASVNEKSPCSGVKKHKTSKYSTEEISDMIYDSSNGEVVMIGSYINMDTKILFKNIKCFHEFSSTPRSIIRGKRCGVCKNSSYGEKLIREFLSSKCIKFEEQKSFDGMIFKKKLRIDFYIEVNNNRIAIEFNGRQHYENTESAYRDSEGYDVIKSRDDAKRLYCEQNNIKLVILDYTMIVKGKLSEECIKILNENI